MPRWSGERPLREARLRYLKSELEAGRLYGPTWAVAFLRGQKFRVNGQHTSTVLAQANGSFPHGLTVNVREYVCDSETDLVAVFNTFDARESARSSNDVIGVAMAVRPELSGISRRAVHTLASGMALHRSGGDARLPGPRERGQMLNECPEFIIAGAPYDGARRNRSMFRTGTAAAMYATWQVDRSGWSAFWDLLFNENHPDANHPTRVLARFLRGEKRGNTNADMRATYAKCIHAWNAYRRGETTSLSYYVNAPVPRAR